MLGLARSLPWPYRSVFLSFWEQGRCQPFLEQVRRHGFAAVALEHNTPHVRSMVNELARCVRRYRADVLCCHGYKADLLGWAAARRTGVRVVSVSRGWTAATLKVRLYEALDRLGLHAMDAVVCVSEGQAAKVRRLGVPAGRVVVIRNAIQAERFANADPAYGAILRGLLPPSCRRVVGAAGRLSPEKGFGVLVEAASLVRQVDPEVGFVLFGDGPLRPALTRQIVAGGLSDAFALTGFRTDVDHFLPHLDLVVLPSFTEGLPNTALEAFAAGVPVVATAVGGTPEVIEEGVNGYLVPPGDPRELARRILEALGDEEERQAMGLRGRQRVQDHFTFAAQGEQYQRLFETLLGRRREMESSGVVNGAATVPARNGASLALNGRAHH
jgi:glycosyltransferase involved in cell wall biosynthesis